MHACVYPGDTRKFVLNFAEMQDGTTYHCGRRYDIAWGTRDQRFGYPYDLR